MSSRSLLAQDDFTCLDLAAGQDAERQPIDDFEGFTSIERGGSVYSLKSEPACDANEMYHPVNFIPDEVYELIRSWELAHLKSHASIHAIHSMDIEQESVTESSGSVFEPMRFKTVAVAPPPKRFFRTFWQSVTRRILQREKKSVLNKVAMTSSDGSSTYRACH
jgi:hypothetical protein